MSETDTPKTMNVWPGVIATGVVIAGMLGASALVWDRIPDRMPIHFGIDGKPDGYGSKWEGLLMMPAVVALIGLIMAVVPQIDPRGNNLARSSGFYYAVWFGELAVMSLVHAGLILFSMGRVVDITQWIVVAIGLMWIVMGNFMGKSRPNWFAGFRTPWTLSSDYAWQVTHRVVGGVFMTVGAAAIVVALLWGSLEALVVLVVGTLSATLYGVYLSYSAWKNDPEKRS